MAKVIAKAVVCWGIMLLAAVLNAAVRESLLTPALGDPLGRAISSLTLCRLIFFLVYLMVPRLSVKTATGLWGLGIFWAGLTIVFEFSSGRLRGLSWESMLSDYNLLEGRLWVLVLVTILASPFLAARLRTTRR